MRTVLLETVRFSDYQQMSLPGGTAPDLSQGRGRGEVITCVPSDGHHMSLA